VICDWLRVVVVPFPFTDRPPSKRRPALVLSSRAFNAAGYTVLAMMTTRHHAPWPNDTAVTDLSSAGLERPCVVRMKLFTLDNRLIEKNVGALAASDAASFEQNLLHTLGREQVG